MSFFFQTSIDIIIYPYYIYLEVALRAGGEEVYGGWRGDGWSPWQPLVFVPIVCGMLRGGAGRAVVAGHGGGEEGRSGHWHR